MPSDDREYILKMAKDHNVRFIRLWFTDILGFLKSFAIPISQLEEALEGGVGFDGSAVQGFIRRDESDMIAMPDPNTFQILPWRPKDQGAVARMFCDILLPDGAPYEGDPRQVLRRTLQRAAEMGYTFYVGPELEFFYFKSAQSPEGLDQGGYFDLTPLDMATDLRRDTILTLEAMGIEVEYSHHEVAPSQHEIDLRYADALTMADNTMTYRLVVKEVAHKYGVYATFMPKPLAHQNGNGMHIHLSLFKGRRNAFFDTKDVYHLSPAARGFIAGLLCHAPEITLVTNQWVNSYKRLVPGFEAPVYITWTTHNRSDLVRVPTYKPGREDSMRIEYRAPDPSCNPYLAFAAVLAAGLEGIQGKYLLGEPMSRNVLEMTDDERRMAGIGALPENLREAIQHAEASELLRKTLGESLHRQLIENKKIEWNQFRSEVTSFELKEYLSIL